MRTEDGPKGRTAKRFPRGQGAAAGRKAAGGTAGGAAPVATARVTKVRGATTANDERAVTQNDRVAVTNGDPAAVGGEAAAAGTEPAAARTEPAAAGTEPAVAGTEPAAVGDAGAAASDARAAAGDDGAEVGLGVGGFPELKRVADPETRRRIAMAAESDLEASRYAHWRGTVTFHDVANAWFNMSDPNLPDDLRAEFKTLFPGLLDAFAEPRKGIITAYFCRHIRVAAALTDIGHAAGAPEGVPEAALKGPPPAGIQPLLKHAKPKEEDEEQKPRRLPFLTRCLHLFEPARASSSAIHIEPTFGDPEDWKAKEILFQCLNLHYRALEFLTPQPRKICMRMIFGVITTLLGTLDHRQLDREHGRDDMPFGSDPAEVQTLERELAQAKAYYRQAAQREAQLQYLVGMLMAIVPMAVITALVAITAGLLDTPAMVAVLGGAVGAVVSVLSRLSGGSLELTPESGRKTLRALGFVRPLIGGVFGAVVYAFLAGGIVDIVSPPTGEGELAFYAGLGFLSGFSERFAQDVIAEGTPKTPPLPDTARSPAHP
jgi:hypothetical protein